VISAIKSQKRMRRYKRHENSSRRRRRIMQGEFGVTDRRQTDRI